MSEKILKEMNLRAIGNYITLTMEAHAKGDLTAIKELAQIMVDLINQMERK